MHREEEYLIESRKREIIMAELDQSQTPAALTKKKEKVRREKTGRGEERCGDSGEERHSMSNVRPRIQTRISGGFFVNDRNDSSYSMLSS